MEIYVQATIGVCSEFKTATDAEKTEVSVVIAPLKVDSENESKLRLVTGCNLWQSCQNSDCWYSIGAREKKKARPGK